MLRITIIPSRRADGPHSLPAWAGMPRATGEMSHHVPPEHLNGTGQGQVFVKMLGGTLNPSPELKGQGHPQKQSGRQQCPAICPEGTGEALLINLTCPLGEGLGISQSRPFPTSACFACGECTNRGVQGGEGKPVR